MPILVLFVKYNTNTPNSGKNIDIHFKKTDSKYRWFGKGFVKLNFF